MAQDQARQEAAQQYGQVVAKAWADPAFKQRLLADPVAVLRAEGIAVPEGLEVRVVEPSEKVAYLALPPRPSEELSDEQLQQVAGGLNFALPAEPCYLFSYSWGAFSSYSSYSYRYY